MHGWTMIFALLASVGGACSFIGTHPAASAVITSIFFSLLCLMFLFSGALRGRER
jgi:hypothetical protein